MILTGDVWASSNAPGLVMASSVMALWYAVLPFSISFLVIGLIYLSVYCLNVIHRSTAAWLWFTFRDGDTGRNTKCIYHVF